MRLVARKIGQAFKDKNAKFVTLQQIVRILRLK